ncbi:MULTISPECIES: 2Fe-2S iron-sulfur cluster-binding protein [Brachybacterium]|uniref:2Fe-2S iron-sulfur cluster binding domain-containing protein n=1 Tax=Brachybacterium kimchii TaxID=2942909 RepID=A0ABY4N9Z1_9MICO|nr:2Fe-2S iron-sulfur cluster binding domain-containing protein [Brachybacterium kimchii]UQN31352.1 2Fe-2S iron-sulfur cluster binding domain-containing protein [Brachybacterium kimchii]
MGTLGEPFTAKCRKSGTTVEVDGEHTLLQALLDAGIDVDYSCEGGVCGTCVLPLLAGDVIHEDEFLMEDEREERMTVCVSRGVGEIELDV